VRQASCLSPQTVDTNLGAKMSVHQSSCNLDESCLLGDCPSFVSVPSRPSGETTGGAAEAAAPLPEPPLRDRPKVFGLRIAGIGGTGVVTLSQIIATAASLDGLSVSALDQTGLAQKGGPVVSDVIFGTEDRPAAVRLSEASADLYLALDPTTAADPKVLKVVDELATAAVASTSLLLTETAIRGTVGKALDVNEYLSKLRQAVRPGAVVVLDAVRLAEQLFGSHLPANMIVLGSAWQAGYLPIGLSSLETAIRLNGGPTEVNLDALRYGRQLVADPARVTEQLRRPQRTPPAQAIGRLLAKTGMSAELQDLVAWRAADIAGYQNDRTARGYVRRVAAVSTAEQRVRPGRNELAAAAARGLHKLTTYKDEYEVARLHLLPESLDELGGVGNALRSRFHLQPPALRRLGMRKKIAVPGWLAIPAFHLLAACRWLRSTPLDPFGATVVRKCERQILTLYEAALDDCAASLTAETYEEWATAASLPEIVRGYEQLKLDSAAEFRRRLAELALNNDRLIGLSSSGPR
jgi:indolepyruvate ferredoxin oxidoreductase